MNAGTLAVAKNLVQVAIFLLTFASFLQNFPAWDLWYSALWLGCSCVGQCHCSEVPLVGQDWKGRVGMMKRRGIVSAPSSFLSVVGTVVGCPALPLVPPWASLCQCCRHKHLKGQPASSYKMYSSMKVLAQSSVPKKSRCKNLLWGIPPSTFLIKGCNWGLRMLHLSYLPPQQCHLFIFLGC